MHRHLHHLARKFSCPFYSHKTRLLALLGPFADRYGSLPYPFIYSYPFNIPESNYNHEVGTNFTNLQGSSTNVQKLLLT